ncbi:MAG: molybdopterin-dependent oxidoreductase [Dehalococcoidia bacterium]|nr:molybdopterin-dependent oxidoreductase [Dehalococcoidia bacterium]
MEYSVVGKRVSRIDAAAKATGEAKYTGDLTLARMLHGKVLRSPYPHARIMNIETSKALTLPGVKAVITGKDTLGIKYGLFPDEYALAMDKVRFIGDGIAAVAATDEEIAAEALALIEVEYQALPAVFDPEQAMRPGAPQIHAGTPNNVSSSPQFFAGDVEQGFRDSDYVREDTFRTQAQTHCTLETHGAVASYDSMGRLTIWTSTQGPYHLSLDLAKTLGMPLGSIRVIKPHVGAGFGGKREMLDVQFCASLLSIKTGRPVRIIYSREEQFTSTRHRHAFIVTIKTGVKKDGSIVAKDCVAIADGGAYNSRGPVIVAASGTQIGSLYRTPNARFRGYHVYTNNPVGGPFRGYGLLQVRFADEVQMDMIAEELGIDPVEIRLKNAIGPNEEAPCGWKITSCGFSECVERASEAAGWKDQRSRPVENQGIGMGCNNYTVGNSAFGQADASSAMIKILEDGTVTVFTGASDIGQGSDTTLAQIAAEELGIRLEDIRISVADTETSPTDLGSYASRVTFIAGNAIRAAAMDAKRQILAIAAEKLEARVEDLVARDRRIYVQGSPEIGLDFKDVIVSAQVNRGVYIMGKGSYAVPGEPWDASTGKGNVSPTYSFGAHVTRIELDPETGQLEMLKEIAAHDCGFAVNPMAMEGQLEGCTACGLGMTFMEERLTVDGQIMNPSFEGYKAPTALETPEIQSIIVESIDPDGPFGAKGVSEAAQVPVAPAVANALHQITGVWFKELPLTPERVLEGIQAHGRGIPSP